MTVTNAQGRAIDRAALAEWIAANGVEFCVMNPNGESGAVMRCVIVAGGFLLTEDLEVVGPDRHYLESSVVDDAPDA